MFSGNFDPISVPVFGKIDVEDKDISIIGELLRMVVFVSAGNFSVGSNGLPVVT